MRLNVPPDLETFINRGLSSGGYANVDDVLRRAREAQDAEEDSTGWGPPLSSKAIYR